jgi:hypothetical protein
MIVSLKKQVEREFFKKDAWCFYIPILRGGIDFFWESEIWVVESIVEGVKDFFISWNFCNSFLSSDWRLEYLFCNRKGSKIWWLWLLIKGFYYESVWLEDLEKIHCYRALVLVDCTKWFEALYWDSSGKLMWFYSNFSDIVSRCYF